MVADLLDTQGALQDSETFRFVADIDVDQRSEIRRMRTLLNNPPR
jgi:ferritin